MNIFKHLVLVTGLMALVGSGISGCATKGAWPSNNPFKNADSVSLGDGISSGAKGLRLIVSSNVNGEFDPCGCAVNPKGGLDRRLNYLRDQATNKPAGFASLILDSGNSMFANEKLDKGLAAKQKKTALAVWSAQRTMGIQLQNVGRLDLAAGLDFVRALEGQDTLLISSNWVDKAGKTLFPTERVFKLENGLTLHVLGLSAGPAAPRDDGIKVKDPLATLTEKMSSIGADEQIIVLSDLGQAKDKEIAAALDRSVIFVGSRDLGGLYIPEGSGKSLQVQSTFQGQTWAVLDAAIKPGANGWYNIGHGIVLKTFWDEKRKEHAELLKQNDSPERKRELEISNESRTQIMKYAPGDLKTKSVFEYKLEEMTVALAKKNELTPVMDALRKLK